MARAKLTALIVERAHRSGEPVLLSDGDGLYLRKQNRDGASWTLRYHFAGRQHWLTLGNYPDMSLSVSRIEARQARMLLDKQQDPLSVRRAALAESRADSGERPAALHAADLCIRRPSPLPDQQPGRGFLAAARCWRYRARPQSRTQYR